MDLLVVEESAGNLFLVDLILFLLFFSLSFNSFIIR